MSLVVECSSCGKRLKAPERLAGKKVRCKCGGVVVIPELVAEPDDLPDLTALIDGDQVDGGCPSCHTPLEDGAVFCVKCGFNTQTGRKMSIDVESSGVSEAKTPAEEDKPKKKTKASKPERESTGTARSIIKGVVVISLMGGIGYGAWSVKNAIFFDPKAQAQTAHGKIFPGMTVEQVVDAMDGKRPKLVETERDPPQSAGPGAPLLRRVLTYSPDFMKKYTPEDLKYGFTFTYRFSERDQLVVYFQKSGKVHSAQLVDPLEILGL